MSLRRVLFVVVCALCVFGATGWAQVAGRISGSVVDATGAAVPGAETVEVSAGGTTVQTSNTFPTSINALPSAT